MFLANAGKVNKHNSNVKMDLKMKDNTDSILLVKNLMKKVTNGHETLTILRDINLSVKKGESLAILGASGSGKTTLLTLLAGIDTPTTGDIYFKSHCLTAMNDEERASVRRREVGFIFQSFHLLPRLTAIENVALPLDINHQPHHESLTQAAIWLERVGLKDRLSHYPSTLSGGEQQRVAIARAFINHPDIIFADEMTGNLDPQTGQQIMDMLFEVNRMHQTTFILVTHDETLASQCHQRVLLKEGILQSC